jgi:hypothetical protein
VDKGVPKLNQYLPFVTTSVLKDLKVNYAGSGEYVSHADGAPVEIDLTLSFQEIQMLNKTVIAAFLQYYGSQNTVVQNPTTQPTPQTGG